MKNKILLASLLLILGQTTQAQGLLGKLKDKTLASGSSKVADKPSESDLKAAEEDKADTYLDGKTINTKDPNNISGIYYSNKIIVGVTAQRKTCILQKFILNFENNQNGFNYTLNHRFSYEEKNGVQVKPVYLNMELFAYKVRKKAGIISFSPDYDAASSNYAYVGNAYGGSIVDGSTVCPKEAKPAVLRLGTFYCIEDGIIAVMPNRYETRDFETTDCFAEFQKYCEPVLLYKKEKEERVKQLTASEIHKKMADYGKKYIQTLDKGAVGSELPRPGNAANSTKFTEPKSKILEIFKQYLASEGITNYIPLYAYIHFDAPVYSDIMIPHPVTGVQVKSGRIVDFIIVAKNTLTDNNGKDPNKYVTAKYVYFHVNFAENVQAQQYNTENYDGKWYIRNCTTPAMGTLDENEDPMKYKGK